MRLCAHASQWVRAMSLTHILMPANRTSIIEWLYTIDIDPRLLLQRACNLIFRPPWHDDSLDSRKDSIHWDEVHADQITSLSRPTPARIPHTERFFSPVRLVSLVSSVSYLVNVTKDYSPSNLL